MKITPKFPMKPKDDPWKEDEPKNEDKPKSKIHPKIKMTIKKKTRGRGEGAIFPNRNLHSGMNLSCYVIFNLLDNNTVYLTLVVCFLFCTPSFSNSLALLKILIGGFKAAEMWLALPIYLLRKDFIKVVTTQTQLNLMLGLTWKWLCTPPTHHTN